MPKLNLSKACLLTNSRAAKPHQIVIRARNGHLVVTKGGASVPWPKDVKLIVKGRSTFKSLMEHLNSLKPEPENTF